MGVPAYMSSCRAGLWAVRTAVCLHTELPSLAPTHRNERLRGLPLCAFMMAADGFPELQCQVRIPVKCRYQFPDIATAEISLTRRAGTPSTLGPRSYPGPPGGGKLVLPAPMGPRSSLGP